MPKKENVTVNTELLNNELKAQSKFFLERNELNDYLKNKQMLKDHSEILKSIVRKKQGKSAKLADFI